MPQAATSGRPIQAVKAKETAKNEAQSVMAKPCRAGGAICAMSTGAATTMARCASPSTARSPSMRPSGGRSASISDRPAPVRSAVTSTRR